MKPFIFLLTMMLLLSCTTTKQTSQVNTATNKETYGFLSSQQLAGLTSLSAKETKDSVIGIAPKFVADTLNQGDAEITKTSSGKKRPVHKQKSENGLTAWIDIDTNGNIHYGANSDSIILVVKSLIRQRDSVSQKLMERIRSDTGSKTDSSYVSNKAVTKQKTNALQWFLNNVYWLAPVIVLIFILIKAFFPSITNLLSWFKRK